MNNSGENNGDDIKKKTRCSWCKEIGHFKRDCEKRKKTIEDLTKKNEGLLKEKNIAAEHPETRDRLLDRMQLTELQRDVRRRSLPRERLTEMELMVPA